MADDRQSPASGPSPTSADSSRTAPNGKTYEVFTPPPVPSPPAAHPSAKPNAETENGAPAGPPPEVSVWNAAKMIRFEEFKTLHQKPCVRDAGITGIATGAAVSGLTAIWGGNINRASSFFVYTTTAVSFAAYQYCLIQRHLEKEGIKRVMELQDQKRAEKEAKMEAIRKERRRLKEERDRQEEEQRNNAKSWWKPW